MKRAVLGRAVLALAVALGVVWPQAAWASVGPDSSFKASPFAPAKALPHLQTPAEDALAKAARADACEALCGLTASVEEAPFGYVSRRRPPIGRIYVYDGTSLLAEYDTNGNEVAKYDYGGDRLIRLTRSDEGTMYFSFDGLGSVTGLTTTTGAVAAAYHLDAWGNYRFTSELAPSKNRFGFTGHYWDNEAGLYYAKARYYDPFTARFTQSDSFLGSIDDPPSLHRYFYANDNPTFYVDLTGFAAKITNALTIDGKGIAFGTDETTVFASPNASDIRGMLDRGEITRSEATLAMVRNNTAPLAKTPDWQKSSNRLWVEGGANQLAYEATAPMLQVMGGMLNNDPVEIAEGGAGVVLMALLPKVINKAVGAAAGGLARLLPSWNRSLKLPRMFSGETPQLARDFENFGGEFVDDAIGKEQPFVPSSAAAETSPVKITIDKGRYPEAAQHVQDAVASGRPARGRIDRGGADPRRAESLRCVECKIGLDRDEFPPAVLDTGGQGASVRHISPSDNRGAGSSMGHQMRKLPDGTLVEIVVKE